MVMKHFVYFLARFLPSIILGYCLFKLNGDLQVIWILISQIFIFCVFFIKRLDNDNIILVIFDYVDNENLVGSLLFGLIAYWDGFILEGICIYLLTQI